MKKTILVAAKPVPRVEVILLGCVCALFLWAGAYDAVTTGWTPMNAAHPVLYAVLWLLIGTATTMWLWLLRATFARRRLTRAKPLAR